MCIKKIMAFFQRSSAESKAIESAKTFIERLRSDSKFRESIARTETSAEAMAAIRKHGFDFDKHAMCEARKSVFEAVMNKRYASADEFNKAMEDLKYSTGLLITVAKACYARDSLYCGTDGIRD